MQGLIWPIVIRKGEKCFQASLDSEIWYWGGGMAKKRASWRWQKFKKSSGCFMPLQWRQCEHLPPNSKKQAGIAQWFCLPHSVYQGSVQKSCPRISSTKQMLHTWGTRQGRWLSASGRLIPAEPQDTRSPSLPQTLSIQDPSSSRALPLLVGHSPVLEVPFSCSEQGHHRAWASFHTEKAH